MARLTILENALIILILANIKSRSSGLGAGYI